MASFVIFVPFPQDYPGFYPPVWLYAVGRARYRKWATLFSDRQAMVFTGNKGTVGEILHLPDLGFDYTHRFTGFPD